MFKKTLLAATIAAVSVNAFATDISTSVVEKYGYEGLTADATVNDGTLTIGVVTLSAKDQYSLGDEISITAAGATFDLTTPYLMKDTTAAATSNKLTFGLLVAKSTANKLVFRVTDSAAGTLNTTVGNTFVLDAAAKITLTSTAVDAEVKFTADAVTSTTGSGSVPLDVQGDKDTAVVGKVVVEHKFAVAPVMNAEIKIAADDNREEFTAPAGDMTAPTYTITHSINAVDQAAFVVDKATFTLTGDMTGFEKGVADSENLGEVLGGAAGAVPYVVAEGLKSAELTVSADGATHVVAPEVVTFTVDGADTAVALNPSEYNVVVKLANAGDKSITEASQYVGRTVLGGATVTFPYAPVGYTGVVLTNFEIANDTGSDADITLDAFDQYGKHYSGVVAHVADAKTVTAVSDADVIKALGLQATGGHKLSLTFSVAVPAADVDDVKVSGYSNRTDGGRMALLSTNFEGK